MTSAAELLATARQYFLNGHVAAADQLCRYVLELDPRNAEALSMLGIHAIQAGIFEQAIDWLRRATQAEPANAGFWNDLAVAYSKAGNLSDAVTACEQAMLLRPDFAHVANNLGLLLQEMGEIERAISYYRHALRVRPDYADVHCNLGSGLTQQGLFDEAVTHYREALRIQPDHVHTYYNLSQFAADGRFQFTPADIQQVRALMRAEALPALSRSVVAFALGNLLDAQGAYDEAFACFQQANDLRWTWEQSNHRGFDVKRHRDMVNEVIATFDHAYFQNVRGWGTDTELPIFILGMPRSGTTLVEQILASHRAVYGAGEIQAFPQLMAELTGHVGNTTLPRPVAFANRAVTQDLSARYLRHITQLGESKNARRITVKALPDVVYLGLIATLFPRARVIYCRRDPRDVCLSCYFQNFQYMDFSWSLEEIAFYYRQYERLMAHWRRVLPMPLHVVANEDLIADQEGVTRELLAFSGLDWDEHCLTFYNTPRRVQTASTLQVRKPLSTKSIGRWKNYRSHLGPLLAALAKPMEAESGPSPASPLTD